MIRIEAFADRGAWADAAAAAIGEALAASGARSFIATGGTTPGPIYDRLAKRDPGWASITVAPTDERFVDPISRDSNEALIRARLLVHRAAAAAFLPLKGLGPSPEDDAAAAEPKLRALLPSAAVLLGMGADGHVGSLFPGSPRLATHLDADGERLCVGVAMSAEKPLLPRISLTVRALLDTRQLFILITGAEKRALIERVLADPDYAPPVAAVIRQDRAATRILWAA